MEEIQENMNVYKKIQWVKKKLLEANLKKSGHNSYSNYDYYELRDFLPTIVNLCNEIGLFTQITFDPENAILKIINGDKNDEVVYYSSPMKEITIKGCNEIQALGGIETYSRRYLYMSAFDIVENDMFDGVSGKTNKTSAKNTVSPKEPKITPNQLKVLEKTYTGDNLKKLLEANKIEKLEDMSMKCASDLISKLKEMMEVKNNE